MSEEISETKEQELLQNPEIKAVLEGYTTMLVHKDIVVKLQEYSRIKGKDNWESELHDLLESEINKSSVVEGEAPNGKNVQKFKL